MSGVRNFGATHSLVYNFTENISGHAAARTELRGARSVRELPVTGSPPSSR